MCHHNALAYWHFCSHWVVGSLRHARTARFPEEHEPWDIYPARWIAALGLWLLGLLFLTAALLPLIALKLLPITLRGYANHLLGFKSLAPLPGMQGFSP